ncbi:MAG: DNA polymerase Y family protein [Rhodomicrobium sp.]
MRRVVSVWLPYWRTERLERIRALTKPLEKQKPLAIAESGKGGRRLAAVNQAAKAAGLSPGMLLTDACAILPSLKTEEAGPLEEAKDLKKLAAWCRRYTPWTAPNGTGGIALDVTGACHLLGGEQLLLDDLIRRLDHLRFTARGAMAGTLGAAWALARFGAANGIVVPGGEEARFIAGLPVKGLRIEESDCTLLKRLGLGTIGQLFDLPRETLRARLGPGILLRLDQVLGKQGEPLSPLQLETVYAAHRNFAEPVSSLDSLLYVTGHLARDVTAQLEHHGKGARRYTLGFYDTQGGTSKISVALARPSHKSDHVLRLFREKFTRLESRFDDTLAFDAAALYAARMEPLNGEQSAFDGGSALNLEQEEGLASLLDRLTARLSSEAVTRFDFRESHIPERAVRSVPVLEKAASRPLLRRQRPLLLLPEAEPVTVLAAVPDYPPRRFTWRRVTYRVTKAEGPERLSPEWWPNNQEKYQTRDYYRVEDETGCRFWLYREGLYGQGNAPCWYLHGLFP